MSLDPLVEEPDAGSEVFPYSTSEADHVYPSAVVASSEGTEATGVSPPTPVTNGSWSTLPIDLPNAVDNDFATKTINGKIVGIRQAYLQFTFPTKLSRSIHTKYEHDTNVAGPQTVLEYHNGATWVPVYTIAIPMVPTIVDRVDVVPSATLYRIRLGSTVNNTSTCDIFELREDGVFRGKDDAIDNDVATYWLSDSEINPSLYGTFSALADKEPSQIALYVDKSKFTALQFLIQTSPDAVIWTTKRTVNVDQLADLQYNFIRFNRDILPVRYIRIIGNDSDARTFAITEFKALIPDAVQWADRQAHKTISTTGIVGLSG